MSDTKYQIEKGIPLPRHILPMPFDKLEVGDSFRVELTKESDRDTIRQRIVRFQKKNAPKRLSMYRDGDDAVRIFRMPDVETS